MTVVLIGVGYIGSGIRVPRYHIPEQIFTRDELIPNRGILSFIKLNPNFIGIHHTVQCVGVSGDEKVKLASFHIVDHVGEGLHTQGGGGSSVLRVDLQNLAHDRQ
jgi:hypothetical protein